MLAMNSDARSIGRCSRVTILTGIAGGGCGPCAAPCADGSPPHPAARPAMQSRTTIAVDVLEGVMGSKSVGRFQGLDGWSGTAGPGRGLAMRRAHKKSHARA